MVYVQYPVSRYIVTGGKGRDRVAILDRVQDAVDVGNLEELANGQCARIGYAIEGDYGIGGNAETGSYFRYRVALGDLVYRVVKTLIRRRCDGGHRVQFCHARTVLERSHVCRALG